MKAPHLNLALAVCIFAIFKASAPATLQGQSLPGPSPFGISTYGSYHSDQIDTVNLDTGNDMIKIPLYSLPQLGRLSLSFSVVSNITYWQVEEFSDPNSGDNSFIYTISPPVYSVPNFNTGIGPVIVPDQFILPSHSLQTASTCFDGGGGITTCENFEYVGWQINDTMGGSHPLYYDSTNLAQLRSTDGSGYLFNAGVSDPYNTWEWGNPATWTVVDPRGIQTAIGLGSEGHYTQTITDPEPTPNTIQYTYSGSDAGQFLDTHLRAIPNVPFPSTQTSGCPNLSLPYQPLVGSSTWTVPGPNGNASTFLICYAEIHYHTNFWFNNGQTVSNPNGGGEEGTGLDLLEEGIGNAWAIQSIVLPDQQSYWAFVYNGANPNATMDDPTYLGDATLAKVIYPQGGSTSYSYQIGATCFNATALFGTSGLYGGTDVVATRTTQDLNGHSYEWRYTINNPSAPSLNIVTDPNGNETAYTFSDAPPPEAGEDNCFDLEATVTTYQGSHSAASPNVLESTQTSYLTAPAPIPYLSPNAQGYGNSAPSSKTTTLNGTATSTSATGYDMGTFTAAAPSCLVQVGSNSCSPIAGTLSTLSLAIPTSSSVVDFTGTSLKNTATQYYWQTLGSTYFTSNILLAPYTVSVLDGSSNPVFKATYTYDNFFRLSTKSLWNNAGIDVPTQTQWTVNGMLYTTTDPNNNVTTNTYETSGQFPSTVTHPATNGIQHADQYTWDLNTGNMLSHTDSNNSISKFSYDDSFGRMISAQMAFGTPIENDSSYSYPSLNEIDFSADLYTTRDGLLKKKVVYDGIGHAILTVAPSGATVRTAFDYFEKPCAVSNPSFADPGVLSCSAGQNPTLTGMNGITYSSRDALGRTMSMTDPDTSTQQWAYNGNVTTYTDEDSHVWTRKSDALNRLTQVVEPGSLTTKYGYDALDNLISVQQLGNGSGDASRNRSFSYDSLSRLTCASNPENSSATCPASSTGSYISGTTGYTYDGNGNILTEQSPAVNVSSGTLTIGYSYDGLNRLCYKVSGGAAPAQYLNGCPSQVPNSVLEFYSYDSSSVSGASNTDGHVTDEKSFAGSTLVSERQPYAYDPLGRLLNENQCVFANCTSTAFHPAYTYNLAGGILTMSDGLAQTPTSPGTPLTFTYSYDTGNRLQSVLSNWADSSHPETLFQSQTTPSSTPCGGLATGAYAASGSLMNATLGSATYGAGIALNRFYDNRERSICEVDLNNGVLNPTAGSASVTIVGVEQHQ